jgi:5-formyltetrahydrofolate cyclo-ligase
MPSHSDDAGAWRAGQRRHLLAWRAGLDAGQKHAHETAISLTLVHGLPVVAGQIVGVCWPVRGEPDLQLALQAWRELGVSLALPQTLPDSGTLVFRPWTEHTPLARGPMGIPYPDSTHTCAPDYLLIPLVGFDAKGYRLGYGGGYFDRTLAALTPRPVCIGVGFAGCQIPDTRAQWHDIPMDAVVTETSAWLTQDQQLHALPSRLWRRGLAALSQTRRLSGDAIPPDQTPPE